MTTTRPDTSTPLGTSTGAPISAASSAAFPAPLVTSPAPPEQTAVGAFVLPWLPEGRLVAVPGRGEVFVRVHRHADPAAPTVLLLHGWTATADLQFFTAYRALAERWSIVAVDHRGHGRGMRSTEPFRLEDAADDAAGALGALGIDSVVAVGYSMGGPVAMHLARRHPDLVSGLVLQATGLEFNGTRIERLTWLWLPAFGSAMRSWLYPRSLRRVLRRVVPPGHQLERYVPWLLGEMQRGNAHALVQAGTALRHHDARPWATSLDVPAGVLLTTRDRLVKPRKQRAMAQTLRATVREVVGDHFCTLELPDEYARATVSLVDDVLRGVPASDQLTASRAS
jgi:3-oxoadipate enol-lactonase